MSHGTENRGQRPWIIGVILLLVAGTLPLVSARSAAADSHPYLRAEPWGGYPPDEPAGSYLIGINGEENEVDKFRFQITVESDHQPVTIEWSGKTVPGNPASGDLPADARIGGVPVGTNTTVEGGTTFEWDPGEDRGSLEVNCYFPAFDNTGTGNCYWITITATDSQGQSTSVDVYLRVEEDVNPPTVEVLDMSPADGIVDIGEELTFTVQGTDTDIPAARFMAYSLIEDPDNPSGATIDADTGAFSWTPTTGQEGSYLMTIIVEEVDPDLPPAQLSQWFVEVPITVRSGTVETIQISIAESVGVTEIVAVTPPVLIQITESVGVSDAVGVRPPIQISITESIGVRDDVTGSPSVLITISETIGVSDTITVTPPVLITISETIGVVDQVTLSPSPLGSVSGFKWEDIDGDAAREAGEPAIEGVTIYLDLDDDATLDGEEPSTATGSDGYYEFTGLVPGEWVVREIVPGGYVQTFPVAGDQGEHRVTLTAGETVDDADFGNQPVDLPPVIEPIDDAFGLVGAEIVVVPEIEDPEGDTFIISWEGGPPNAVINGIWVLTPTEDQAESVFEITVTATEVDNPANSTSETFNVLVAGVPDGPTDPLDVDPVSAPGEDIEVKGGGFFPGSDVKIYFLSDPVLLGTETVGSDGTFSASFALPDDATDGPHQIVVVGFDPDGSLRTLSAQIDVIRDGDDDGLRDTEEALTGTNPDNPDTDGDGLIDGLDASWLIAYLDELPGEDFKRRWNRPVMKLTIGAAAIAVNLGKGEVALDILEALDRRVDGCGTQPDRSDWIVDCEAQLVFRELLGLYRRGIETLPLPNPIPWL